MLTDRFDRRVCIAILLATPTHMAMIVAGTLNLSRATALGRQLREPKGRAPSLVVLAIVAQTEGHVAAWGDWLVEIKKMGQLAESCDVGQKRLCRGNFLLAAVRIPRHHGPSRKFSRFETTWVENWVGAFLCLLARKW